MVETRPLDVTSDYYVPEALKANFGDVWIVWCPTLGKTPRAPWQEGHMYPCQWAEDKADPRVSFEKAVSVAMEPVDAIAARWPFPPDTTPETVLPGVLLPPRAYEPMFVDLDDVILDGEITAEAWDIIQRLGGYAEVSKSYIWDDGYEAGAHAWVRGSLPGDRKKIITDLDGPGQLELYTDQARMTGGTWRHIQGTPQDAIPDAQPVIDSLIETYADLDDDPPERSNNRATTTDTDQSFGGNTKRNPYYQLDITVIADTGPFREYQEGWRGPHPAHGGTSSEDSESINFNVNPSAGIWYCFAHDDGGGPLSLIAILEDIVDCGEAKTVHRENNKLLETCLAARDEYAQSALDDEEPPYNALVAVADRADLEQADPEESILGESAYRYAFEIYTCMSHPLDET